MDSYSILGVRRDASTEEINAAYRSLADKYSEDKYSGGPLADLAAKKRKEIENAYDDIIKTRAAEKANAERPDSTYSSYGSKAADPKYLEIRSLINSGNITAARAALYQIQTKDAEWFYLNGLIALRTGRYNEAFSSFKAAVNKDPSNPEYNDAYNRMNSQAQSYRNVGGPTADMNQCCSCCNSLICADCCCECMGGDLVPCC